MRKLEIADPDITRIVIQQEIARSDESRYDHRSHGLLLLTSGQSCQKIANLFGEDWRTVQRWVKCFEEHGLDGMWESERPGRLRLSECQALGFSGVRPAPPQRLGFRPCWGRVGRQIVVRAPQAALAGHSWVCVNVSASSDGVGFRLHKPPRQPVQSDRAPVAAFKKTSSSGNGKGH